VQSPTGPQLDAAIFALSWLFWFVWVYVAATTLLRIGVILGERVAAGTAWVRSLRWLSDLLTLPFVRRAVDASLAGALLVRVAVMAPNLPLAMAAPLTAQVDQIQDRTSEGEPSASTSAAEAASRPVPADLEPGDIVHVVRPGESLAYLGKRYLGDPDRWKQIYADNRDRPQPDGSSLQEAGKIFPGWLLVIRNPTRLVEYDAEGRAWHTVRHGESLWKIADVILGDGQRWPELFAPNRGAQLSDGHILSDPNVIWAGLRLRIPSLDRGVPEPDPGTPAEKASVGAGAAPAVSAVAEQSDRASTLEPVPSVTPVLAAAPVDQEPTPTAEPAAPSPTAAPAPISDSAPESGIIVTPPEAALAAGAAAAAALAAGRLVVHRRRPAPIPTERESDVQIADGFAEADPVHDLARRLAYTPDPPTVIAGMLGQAYMAVFDEQLRGNQREEATEGVSVAATRHGRTSTTVVLAAPVAARPHLVRSMRAAAERAFGEHVDVDGQVDSNRDVLVRVTWHPRRPLPAHLFERAGVGDGSALASAWAAPALVPALVLYDRQHLAIDWHSLHNVLVAAPTGQGADVPLVALVAALCSKWTPEDLGLIVVARPHTLPGEIGLFQHGLGDVVDAGDPPALQEALESVKLEIERRRHADAADEADLVVVVRELGDLEPAVQRLLGEIAAAGPQQRVQLIAASERPVTELLDHCPYVDQLGTRLVLQTATEEDSVALLGMPGAETIGAGGYALLRLEGRLPVPGWAYGLPADRLAGLAHMMGTRAQLVSAPAQAAPSREGEGVVEAEAVAEAEPPPGDQPVEPLEPAAQEQAAGAPAAAPAPPRPDRRKGGPAWTDQASQLARLGAAPLRVRCFGTGEVWYGDRLLELGNPELLLLFGVHPIKGITNEALAEMLTWKKFPSDINAGLRTRRYDLRQELYRLVPELEGDPLPGDEYQGEKVIALNPALVASDVHEFDLLLEIARKLDPPAAIETYEAALSLYGGD
ncbi:MAG TPA: hypothetical protein VF897_12295, partial [Roseiflexaceae bacterium]